MRPIARIMFPIIFVVGILIVYYQVKEWARLRNGCGKHDWINHDWNEPHCRQVRWCEKCGIRQARLSDEYVWGKEW